VDALGDLLDTERVTVAGQYVQHLEIAAAQAVLMQRAVEFALGAGVQRQHLPPLVHERLLGLLRRHDSAP
jgi:hypothetical protein